MSLSERKAALNRSVAGTAAPTSPNRQPIAIPLSAGVKDKAARFDGLGPAPAPKAAFGAATPMTSGQKTNRELYGNRIPKQTKDPHEGGNGGSSNPPSSLGSDVRSRSPSRSRKTSMELGGAEPLTEAAVESLGTAVLVDPAGGAKAFVSAPPSGRGGHTLLGIAGKKKLLAEGDASSSVAVEHDSSDVGTPMALSELDGPLAPGQASPALTTSTMSESAMKEAPPILSPVPSSTQISLGRSSTSRSLYDPQSVAATDGSGSTHRLPMDSSDDPPSAIADLKISGPETPSTPPSSTQPMALSQHLLQSLQAGMPSGSPSHSGMETPKSVMVETGSANGREELAEKMAEVQDISDARMIIDETPSRDVTSDVDLASDKGEDVEQLDVQPDLRMAAPVVPLSTALLKSLNIPSSRTPGASTGMETPRSMAVEDGSDGGRSPIDLSNEVEMGDEDYIASDAPTPPGFVINLPPEDRQAGGPVSPGPESPAILAYTKDDNPLQAQQTGPNLSVPGQEAIDLSATPVANKIGLPEFQMTPPAIAEDRSQEGYGLPGSSDLQARNTVKGRNPVDTSKDDSIRHSLPEFNLPSDNEAEITPTSLTSPSAFGSSSSVAAAGRRLNRRASSVHPAMEAEVAAGGAFFTSRLRRVSEFSPPGHLPPPLNVALQYLDKPLPAPPSGASTPTPTSSGPGTPQLLQNFPPVPTFRINPSNPTSSSTAASSHLTAYPNSAGSRTLHPLSMLGVTDGTRRPGGIQVPTSPGGHSPRSVSLSSTAEFGVRPRTTEGTNDPKDKARPSSSIMAPSMSLRRSVSTMDLGSGGNEGTQKRRPKKPQLVPGVWIGDDDVRDDEEGPGWATITDQFGIRGSKEKVAAISGNIVSILYAYWIGYAASIRLSPTSDRQWMVPIGIQLLPGGLFAIGLFFVPESPRWLALNEVRKARDSMPPSSHPSKADLEAAAAEAEKITKKEEDVAVTGPALEQVPTPEIVPQAQEPVPELQGGRHTPSSASSFVEPDNIHLYGSLARRIFTPRSPRSTPNASEALCALAYLRRQPLSSPTLRAEMAEIYAQLEEAEEERRNGKGNLSEQLKKMSLWKRLATGSFVGAWQIWTGQTAILYYAPTIFMSIGFSTQSTSLLASGVFTCLKVFTTALALMTTVHRFGRVISMSVGGALQGLLFFIIGILLATHPVDPMDASPDPPSFVMMSLIYIYVLVYSFTLGPLPWVYGSEIFPTHLRDAGHLVFVCITWSNNFAVAKLTPMGFAGIGWVLWMIYGSFNL
ncbi:hypothetical protein FRC04_011780 [Tulasnella sp. 424]|nr:hypothetical protein FRC04_011780 [Tulasnella sp. 424]